MKIKLLLGFLIITLSVNAQTLEFFLKFDNDDYSNYMNNGITFSETEGQTIAYADHEGFGRAIDLRAAADFVANGAGSLLSDQPVPQSNDDGFTVCLWVYLNYGQYFETTTFFRTDVEHIDPPRSDYPRNVLYVTATDMSCWAETNPDLVPHGIPQGEWHHMAVVLDPYTGPGTCGYRYYVDGDTIYTYDAVPDGDYWGRYQDEHMRVFGRPNGNFFTGMADEVMFFTGALTDEDIANIYVGDYSSWEDQIQTSVNDVVSETAVSVFPNPVKDGVVTVNGVASGNEYSVYSIAGTLVQTGVVEGSQIDVNGLQAGLWLVKIGTDVVRLSVK